MSLSQHDKNVLTWVAVLGVLALVTARKAVAYVTEKISRAKFRDLITPLAQDESIRSGIHPLITISQAAHESAWGTSVLTQKANNLFGLTGDSWEKIGKPIIKMQTDEYINGLRKSMLRPFRAYTSWAESIRDWSTLLHQPHYKLALAAAQKGDITAFATEVSKAGYATDPSYTPKLIQVASAVRALVNESAA